MDNKIHELQFNVKVDNEKGLVRYLSTTFNGEETELIPDGSSKTVSTASELIRLEIMKHKRFRYSRN